MAISASKVTLSMAKVLIVILVLFAGYTWVALNWSYSKGERAGYLQKFSHKGWLCKTWEGELQMIPAPGVLPEKFLFSVRSDAVAARTPWARKYRRLTSNIKVSRRPVLANRNTL